MARASPMEVIALAAAGGDGGDIGSRFYSLFHEFD
jgi:hypothetical protein